MTDWLPLLVSGAISILGGGVLGVWLTHRRLSPRSKAEAKDITAAAQDKDWSRFQREISRLVKRVEDAETRAEQALRRAHDCEEREAGFKAEITRLEALMLGMGQGRQRAAAIVAADRLNDGLEPRI